MHIINFRWKILMMAAAVGMVLVLGYNAPAWAVKPGTVLKSVSGTTLYFVTGAESLAGIPSPEVYNCLQLSKQNAYRLGQDKIDGLKKTKLLLRGPDGKIYLIEGTQKRHITSPAVFKKHEFDNAEVISISAPKLACIPDGKPVN